VPRKSKRPKGLAERVGRYRRKLAQAGVRRVEVTVPARDSTLIRDVAQTLRAGGSAAARLREALRATVAPAATTGADLVAFFRASPFVGAEVEIERDKSTGRPIEF
jgi:isopropylmalate/homocitrate/citramalate synthase